MDMKKLSVYILIAVCAVTAVAQQRLSPELLWKLGRVGDEQISPDGSMVMFGVTEFELSENKSKRDLYIAEMDLSRKEDMVRSIRQIETPDVKEYNARWTKDGRIVYLSSESGSMQMWTMDSKGNNKKQLTDLSTSIKDFELGANDEVVMSMDVKMDATVNEVYKDLPMADARIIDDLMYRHWNQWHDYAYSHVFTMPFPKSLKDTPVDVMKGERNDSPLPPFGGSEQYTISPDGKTVAYTSKKIASGVEWAQSTNSDIYLYDIASGKTTNLSEGMNGYDVEPSYSPDGRYLAWMSMKRNGYESDRNRIFVKNLKSGAKFEVTKGFAHPAGHVSWTKDGKSIFFTAPINATYQMFEVKVAQTKGPNDIRQVTNGQHNFNSVHVVNDQYLLGHMNSMSYPAELFLVNRNTGATEPVTEINAKRLSKVDWGKVEKRMVKTTDGKEMLTWVIYPPNFDPKKKYPTLLYCQGGPQSAVSQFFSYRWNFQLMAANDYIIVAPNRRGLPSFGEEWNEEISQDWGGQAMRDYLAAIDDVSKESYVDEDRLGAVGASYGGYSVYYLAGMHEKRFKTFISHCGLFNLDSWYGSTEELFFANWDIGGPYWESPAPKSYEKFSPHRFVQNWDTPMLVIHGAQDFRVPLNQGMEAFQAAKLKGIPARFLYFPGEGHWVQSPQNGVVWHRVFFEWLDSSLK